MSGIILKSGSKPARPRPTREIRGVGVIERNSAAMRSTDVCPPNCRRDLSVPMRLDLPPTRMNPSTSNIATTCYYFRETWAILTDDTGSGPLGILQSYSQETHGITKTPVDAPRFDHHRAFDFFSRSAGPG